MDSAAQRTGFPSLDMTGAVSPAIDINETDAAIELTAELPGLAEDDVEIELRDRRLTLRGQKNVTHDNGGDLQQLLETEHQTGSLGYCTRNFQLEQNCIKLHKKYNFNLSGEK